EELDYNQEILTEFVDQNEILLNSDQQDIYNDILRAVEQNDSVRSQGKLALAVASSGITALLLNVQSDLAELIRQTILIVWDKAPMMHHYAFEAVDRTLRDIMSNNEPFSGKVIVFGGDFRQVLPVVPRGRREDIINACLCQSWLWQYVKVKKLTINMRLKRT
ncbi:13392_t:CDS:2, partial [Ambispora leptoticha]